jgi:hypothetical protein
MDTDEMDTGDNSIDEFITQMNNSDQYKNIFKIMVKGRRLFFRVQGMNEDFGDSRVADNLLYFNRIGLSWNNPADRVSIMRVEASEIRHLLQGIGRFRPNEEDEEEADSLIISLSNYMTNTEARGLRKGKRKRKTKSKKTKGKSKKSVRKSVRKSKKSVRKTVRK